MAGMSESCSVCGKGFEVQFRYQMEERDGGFAFFCSQACHSRNVRGDATGGVTCDACGKRFVVELVSQVLRVHSARKYACSDDCRVQVLAEAGGAKLNAFVSPEAVDLARHAANTTTAPTPAPPAVAIAAVQAAPLAPPAPAGASATPAAAPTSGATLVSPPRIKAPLYGPRRLAIFNHKGGTGKTTTSVSIAAGLAERGLKVLLVDTDSQGNVGVSLDVKAERSLYHVLVMGLKAKDAALTVRPNLDLIASNETLAAAELYLAGRQNRDRILRDRLVAATDDYDVVILDCSPSLSLMNQNALVFADGILVPVACDFLSLVGVRQVIKTVKNVNALLHHPVQIFGVLPTFYDARARICRDAVDTLKQHFGDRCLAPIRATTKIKEAPAQGKTIFEYAADSNAAEDYRRVVDLIALGPAAASAPAGRASASNTDDAEDGARALTA
jgi:chromosome partitioning protein